MITLTKFHCPQLIIREEVLTPNVKFCSKILGKLSEEFPQTFSIEKLILHSSFINLHQPWSWWWFSWPLRFMKKISKNAKKICMIETSCVDQRVTRKPTTLNIWHFFVTSAQWFIMNSKENWDGIRSICRYKRTYLLFEWGDTTHMPALRLLKYNSIL